MGRIARAFTADLGNSSGCSSVGEACKVSQTHGERDCQKLFRRFNLSLQVPISELHHDDVDGGPVTLPFLNIKDYFGFLLKTYPKLLHGGLDLGPEQENLCLQFWQGYRLYHPEHEIYSTFMQDEWKRILPVALHGDKGRTLNKQPIYCFGWETVFGLPLHIRTAAAKAAAPPRHETGGKLNQSCSERAQTLQNPETLDDAECPRKRRRVGPSLPYKTSRMPHNQKGHVYLSHWLGTCIPSKVFRAHPGLIDAYLEEVAKEMTDLFHVGVPHGGSTYRCAVIGVKGDLEFFLETAYLNRSYQNIGTSVAYPFCPDCQAGFPGIPGIDTRDIPGWKSTLYSDEPWDVLPILNRIPFASTKRPALYRKDVFHTCKFGFLKDLNAGILMLLCEMKYLDSPGDPWSMNARLSRAFGLFKLWLSTSRKSSGLRKFSKVSFHRDKATKYPFMSGKGSDSVVVLEFLEWLLRLKLQAPKEAQHTPVLSAMLETVQGALCFIGTYHSHGIFYSPPCAKFSIASGLRLFRGYVFLAKMCIRDKKRYFSLKPKVHYFHHVLVDMQDQVDLSHEVIFNAAAVFNAEGNEDFIGKVSRISRRVSPKQASRRTMEHYLVACRLLYKKSGL